MRFSMQSIRSFPKLLNDDICRLATSLDIRFRGMPNVFQTVVDMEMEIKKFLESIVEDMAQYSKLSVSTDQPPPPKTNESKLSYCRGPLLDTELDDLLKTDLSAEFRSYLILLKNIFSCCHLSPPRNEFPVQ